MTLYVNDPQFRMPDFLPEFDHEPPSSFQETLAILDEKADRKSTV